MKRNFWGTRPGSARRIIKKPKSPAIKDSGILMSIDYEGNTTK